MLTIWEEDYLNLGLVSGGSVSSGVPLSEWPICMNMLFKVVQTIHEKAFIPNLLLATAPCYRPSWSVITNVLLEEFTQQRSFLTLPKWIISFTTVKVCVWLNGFPAVFCVLEIWASLLHIPPPEPVLQLRRIRFTFRLEKGDNPARFLTVNHESGITEQETVKL